MHFSTRTVRRSMFTLNTSFYFKGDRCYRKVHINIHELKNILHTVLYTFPKVPLKRICLAIKSLFSW